MKIIGHRGAAGLARENTAAAFKTAIELGIDGIEFDLHVTRDGIPVVHHDPDIKEKAIINTTYAELRALDGELLTFKQTLALTGDMRLFVEVKPGVTTAPIVAELAQTDLSRINILSFDDRILAACAEALPSVPRYALEKWSTLRLLRKLRRGKTRRAILRHTSLWNVYIRLLTRSGIEELYTYTLNDPKKAARFARSGLTGVITDFPDRFKN
jgi:glycerophosphoryl diester phosphodiesterase